MRCPFPYFGDPETIGCTQTIAQSGGNQYKNFLAGWIVASVVLFLVTVVQLICLLRIRGSTWKICTTSYLHQLYFISLYNTFTLVIRMSDPLNWDNRINQTVYRILICTSTWAVYALLLSCICSWLKVVRRISGRSRDIVTRIEHVTLALTFLFYLSIGIAEVHVEKTYVARNVELVFSAVYMLTMVAVAWILGLRLYCSLLKFSTPPKPAESGSHDNDTPQQVPSPAPAAAQHIIQTPPASPRTNNKPSTHSIQRRNKTRITVILKLLSFISVIVVLAAAFQFIFFYSNLNDRVELKNNPEPYPEFTFGGLIQQCGFYIAQALSSVCILVFFHKFGYPRDQPPPASEVQSPSTQKEKEKTMHPEDIQIQQSIPPKLSVSQIHVRISDPITPNTPTTPTTPTPLLVRQDSGASNSAMEMATQRSDVTTPRSPAPIHPRPSQFQLQVIHPNLVRTSSVSRPVYIYTTGNLTSVGEFDTVDGINMTPPGTTPGTPPGPLGLSPSGRALFPVAVAIPPPIRPSIPSLGDFVHQTPRTRSMSKHSTPRQSGSRTKPATNFV